MNLIRSLVLVLAALLLCSPYANGSVSELLDEMYMSASSSAGFVETQNRGALVGGSYTLRAPIHSVNLVNFSPPRFTGGCGGVSLWGGSFSYVNKDQFTEIAKAVAANALAYVFMSAVDGICPKCATIMRNIQEIIMNFNRMFRNTCQIARGGFDTEAWEELANSWGSMWAVGSNEADDAADADDSSSSQASEPAIASKDAGNPLVGNMVWRMMEENSENIWRIEGLIGVLSGASGSDETVAKELLMSITGTLIYDPMPACSGYDASSTEAGQPIAITGPLNLSDLAYGGFNVGQDGQELIPSNRMRLACDDVEGCMCVMDTPLEFPGLNALIAERLSELRDQILQGDPLEDGEMARFLSHFPVGVYGILNEFRGQPETMDVMIRILQPMLVRYYHAEVADAVNYTIRSMARNVSGVRLPPEWNNRVAQINDEALQIMADSDTMVQDIRTILDVLQQVRVNAAYTRPGRYNYQIGQ